MTDQQDHQPGARPRRRLTLALAATGLLGLGGAVGAVTVATTRPAVTMAPATPVAIRSMSPDSIVTVRGRVAEIYGNKFVLADAGARALVDTGREGEDAALVAAGEPVTVQGRFEHGFVHAAFLVRADGKVSALGPLGGSRDHRGPPRGHDGGPDGPPPPLAPAGDAARSPAGA